MRLKRCFLAGLAALAISGYAGIAMPQERMEHFDKEPAWEERNNRASDCQPRTIRQDFGYSRTHHAGGAVGEIGGFITAAAEPAYYARKIPTRTLQDTLTASGSLAVTGRAFHVLLGFFHTSSLKEWRTPNTLALRLLGRGDVFYAYVEYATSQWRAGGDSPRPFPMVRDPEMGRDQPRGFAANGTVHHWSLRYDPQGNHGGGSLIATLDGQVAICNLEPGHKADGARFNRFGLLTVMKSADDGGEVWLDDVTVNGVKEDFTRDPGWEGFHNRRVYATRDIRPCFDFGYSPTRYAGGKGKGELGGLVFRGDCRDPRKMASYADRLSVLTLERPLKASGKVSLRRGVSDSTTLIGFFHSRDSMTVNDSQSFLIPRSFLGIALEGPSREGFFFAPAYHTREDAQGYASDSDNPPRILPDGSSHTWSLEYVPGSAEGEGYLLVALDRHPVKIRVNVDFRKTGTQFDRFGIITTWIDGNGQRVYFDDLQYTSAQERQAR